MTAERDPNDTAQLLRDALTALEMFIWALDRDRPDFEETDASGAEDYAQSVLRDAGRL